jgi:hypothetical protein
VLHAWWPCSWPHSHMFECAAHVPCGTSTVACTCAVRQWRHDRVPCARQRQPLHSCTRHTSSHVAQSTLVLHSSRPHSKGRPREACRHNTHIQPETHLRSTNARACNDSLVLTPTYNLKPISDSSNVRMHARATIAIDSLVLTTYSIDSSVCKLLLALCKPIPA